VFDTASIRPVWIGDRVALRLEEHRKTGWSAVLKSTTCLMLAGERFAQTFLRCLTKEILTILD